MTLRGLGNGEGKRLSRTSWCPQPSTVHQSTARDTPCGATLGSVWPQLRSGAVQYTVFRGSRTPLVSRPVGFQVRGSVCGIRRRIHSVGSRFPRDRECRTGRAGFPCCATPSRGNISQSSHCVSGTPRSKAACANGEQGAGRPGAIGARARREVEDRAAATDLKAQRSHPSLCPELPVMVSSTSPWRVVLTNTRDGVNGNRNVPLLGA